MKVAVYAHKGHARARQIAKAVHAGITAIGDQADIRPATSFGGVDSDAAVFYGYAVPLPVVMADYVKAGRFAVHIDLGYWGRRDGGRYCGYHKVAVNARHPDAYFRKVAHPPDRVARFGLQPGKWRLNGRHVLVAGMSGKHAVSEGWAKQHWERKAIEILRRHTDRPIWYRPKPSDASAEPIDGTRFDRGSLSEALRNCHAVVTHHSNVAIDAALVGVPSFSQVGVATAIGRTDMTAIEDPIYPADRLQWLADIAYCQWNLAEMESGAFWRHLRDEGIVA